MQELIVKCRTPFAYRRRKISVFIIHIQTKTNYHSYNVENHNYSPPISSTSYLCFIRKQIKI